MGDVFGPLKQGQTQDQLNKQYGGKNMIDSLLSGVAGGGIPPLSGGDAGPSGAVAGENKSGNVYVGGLSMGSSNWLTYLVIGSLALGAYRIWKKK